MEIIIRKGSSKESMEQSLKQLKPKKGGNVSKYCGIMKLKKDALQIQRGMRNEWN